MYVCDGCCFVVVCSLVLMGVVTMLFIALFIQSHSTMITDTHYDVAGIEALRNS